MESVLKYVPNKVIFEMNVSLTAPFMAEGIHKALFDMHPSRAPGDNLIFCRANAAESGYFKNCLRQYEMASRQLINFEKSSISFIPNTNNNVIEHVKQLFGISIYMGIMYI
eukprot:XP_025014412.1 uncharacterized protein LOC112536075 [Ricinus communis]